MREKMMTPATPSKESGVNQKRANEGDDDSKRATQDDADAHALVKAPFVQLSGPAARVCKGRSLWTGKTEGGEDECEQKCLEMGACRFISFSNTNWCRLTATCDSTWVQEGKTMWIFARQNSTSFANKTNMTVSYIDLSMSMSGVNHGKLVVDSSLLESFESTAKSAIATGAGAQGMLPNGPGDVVLVLTSKSQSVIDIEAKITRPANATLTQVLATLKTSVSSGQLAADVAAKIGAVPGLGAACTTALPNLGTDLNEAPINGMCTVSITTKSNPEIVVVQPQMKAVIACMDAEHPGLEFVNGSAATCPMLRHYCNHGKLGHLVRDQCSKTCGFCAIELDTGDNKSASAFGAGSSSCRDGAAHEPPQFHEAGHALECNLMRSYCKTDPHVMKKCRVTCDACPVPTPTRAPTPASASVATSVVSATPNFHQTLDDALSMGCSRRRMMGNCHTRRRRVA